MLAVKSRVHGRYRPSLMRSFSTDLAHLHEPLGILGGRSFLIVVEVPINRKLLSPPQGNRSCPAIQCLLRIAVFVLPRRSMAADVHVLGGYLPGRRRVVVVRDAQSNSLLPQQVNNARHIPAWIAKLECIASFAVEQLEE